MNIPGRILAVDFGLRRIGLALSDPLKTFSYPFDTFLNDNKFWDRFGRLLKEQEVEEIVLGYPEQKDGQPSEVAGDIMKFKETIEKKYSLPVTLWDERYTSEMAKQLIIKTVSKKSKRKEKGLLDMSAAAIILQEYLDERGRA